MRTRSILWILPGVLSTTLAMADAVPPPPPCPDGKVGISNHEENSCVDPPPKDCPAGWFPELRGLCELRVCQKSSDCGAGYECKPASVCQHDEMRERRGRSQGPPYKVTVTAGICSDGIECPDGNECKKPKICLPKDVAKPAPWKGQPKPTKPAKR